MPLIRNPLPPWTRSIWTLMKGERIRYGAALAALIVASGFLYLPPLVAQIVIDGVLVETGSSMTPLVARGVSWLGGHDWLATHLWWPGLLIVLLTLLAGGFTYLRGRWSARASEHIARKVRDRLYHHLQHLSCSYFDAAQTGDLVQRCTSDVETLRVFLTTQVVEIGRALVMLVMPIPFMLAIDQGMTGASLVLIAPIVIFSLVYFRRVRKVYKMTDEAEGRLTTTVQENLTGIRVVRAFARQAFEVEKLEQRNREHRDLDYRMYRLAATFWSTSDFLCFLQKAIVVAYGAYRLAEGSLPVGAFFFFLTAVSMFIWPVRMMGRILTDLGKAIVALERLQEILDEDEETDLGAPAAAQAPGAITFDGVSFAHGEDAQVLNDVSFQIEAGGTLALVGPSGSGKSTIVNLLLRLYDYDAGSITIDGRELATLGRKNVRSQIAVVMQEPFLYSKTLRDNITLGRSTASEEEMLEATRLAAIHESITDFDDSYDTRVGERGVTLSGGQRQRVALSRALLQEPAILVLDDALSAVDAETEHLIIEAFRRRRHQHTTVVIAHRLSTLMHADRIVVLDHGAVAQYGSHDELLAEAGLYRRLWDLQTGLEASADAATVTPGGTS